MLTTTKTMKAVVVERLVGKYADGGLEECLVVKQVPIPTPKYSQVLVKVQRSQINPSDTSFVQGRYGRECTPGKTIPGFECAGTVVGHGGSPLAWYLMGRRVSVFAQNGGCWAEYVVCDWSSCIDVGSDVPWSNAAGAIANPMTVVMMCEIAHGEKVVVCTAGTSSLVDQFVRAAKSRNLQTICVVRKPEDVATCQANGALATLDSTAENFAAQLKQLCQEHKVRMAFDSVGGDAGSAVFAALVAGGEMHVYGFLSGKPVSAPGAELIFKRKTLKGLWLGQQKGLLSLMRLRGQVIAGLKSEDLATKVRCTFPLDQVAGALTTYTTNLSGGKVHLVIGQLEEQV